VTLNKVGRILIIAGCVGIGAGLAAQDAPVPPVQGSLSPVLVTEPVEIQVTPDDRPLTGGQVLGIGSKEKRHSFIVPSLRVSETLDSNPLLLSTNNGSYRGFTDFGSTLQWHQYFGRDMEFRYSGGFRYDTKARLQGYDQFTNAHGAGVSKIIRFRNSSLLIDDEASYSRGAAFGNVGLEGLGTIGTLSAQLGNMSASELPSNSLRPDLLPNQSILSGQVGRISNTSLVELDTNFNARDTATLAASYGLLRFNSSLLNNTNQASAVAGYNHRMTARDSVAVEGAFTRFDFSHNNSHIATEYVSALYARRISGRSSVEVGAGPQIIQSHFTQKTQTDLNWQARGSVRYQLPRMGLVASGSRGVSGGAGVLEGAITTTGEGSANFRISRFNSMTFTAGVARNQQLDTAGRYDTQYLGLVLNREVLRFTNVFLSYDFQHQTTNSSCTGPICNFSGLRNVFGIGLAWTHSPIGVQ
jgi:hypothetical protein